MKKIIALVLLIGMESLFAQQTIFQNRNSHNTLFGTSAMNKEVNLEKEAKGSQYFQDSFLYAFVDDMEKPFKMRYNAFFDEMEFDQEGVIYDLDKEQYQSVNFDDINKKYVLANYQDGNENKRGFLVELVGSPKTSLLKSEKIIFVEGKKATSGFGIDTPSEYKADKERYFLKLADGSIVSAPGSKNKFVQLFDGKEKQIEKFMKENRTSLSDEKELKKLVEYINTL